MDFRKLQNVSPVNMQKNADVLVTSCVDIKMFGFGACPVNV